MDDFEWPASNFCNVAWNFDFGIDYLFDISPLFNDNNCECGVDFEINAVSQREPTPVITLDDLNASEFDIDQ